MDDRPAIERMFDYDVRVEHMFWVAGISASPPQEFDDFIEEDLPEEADILEELPWLAMAGATGEDICSEFAFKKMDGFFIQLGRPVPRDFNKDGTSYTSSWGSYRTKWIFVAKLEQVLEKAAAFSDEVVADARKKEKQHAYG